MSKHLTEGRMSKGGQNDPADMGERPPAPGGSGGNATIPFRGTLPSEVWALRRSDGGLVPTYDEGPYHSFMAFASERDAIRAAVDQNEKWDCNCEAVLLFKKARRP